MNFNIRVDHYLHIGDDNLQSLIERMDIMSAGLDALKAAVENEITVSNSAIVLLNGLSEQIKGMTDDPALIELADEINVKALELSDAITANTI